MFLGLGTFYSYRACSLRPALFPLLEEAVDANGVFLLGRVAAAEQVLEHFFFFISQLTRCFV
jgi:hypothetical protein